MPFGMASIVVHTKSDLQSALGRYRTDGQRIALVPTMGALHEGHLALVKLARQHADRVVVSVFVNPTQFAPHEDFDRYPRTLDSDVEALGDLADLVYAPSVADMYPEDFATRVLPQGGPADGLESDARPHFFGGVATVVAKLLLRVQPDVAIFGEKDWQQLQVVTQMVRDLDIATSIIPGPTVRESDGLALSSRNRYLSAEDRAAAPILHRSLTAAAGKIAAGADIAEAVQQARREIESAGFSVDYVEARHAKKLTLVSGLDDGSIRLLVAARIGGTRLIDNVPVIRL